MPWRQWCNLLTDSLSSISQLAFELCVDTVLQIGTGSKVNQLQLPSVEVQQNVFVLDVKVHDAGRMNLPNSRDDLDEELASGALRQSPMLSDKVEQVHHLPATQINRYRHRRRGSVVRISVFGWRLPLIYT